MDLLTIKNTSTMKPLVLNGNERVVIEPGDSRIVPFAFAAAWFGDPRAKNEGKERGRQNLYESTRRLWGFEAGFDTEETWTMLKAPQFQCFDTNTNDRVFMLIEDPDGEHDYNGEPIFDSSNANVDALTAQIAAMQTQMAALMQMVATQQGNTETAATAAEQTALATVATPAPGDDTATAGVDPSLTAPAIPEAPATESVKADTPKATRIGR